MGGLEDGLGKISGAATGQRSRLETLAASVQYVGYIKLIFDFSLPKTELFLETEASKLDFY